MGFRPSASCPRKAGGRRRFPWWTLERRWALPCREAPGGRPPSLPRSGPELWPPPHPAGRGGASISAPLPSRPARPRTGSRRRLHGHQRQKLEHVVLDDVAEGAGLLVVAASSLHSDALRHGDLNVIHVLGVP